MADWVDADEIVDALAGYLEEYERTIHTSPTNELIDRLERWKTRVTRFIRESISEEEAARFEKIKLKFDALNPHSFNAMLERPQSALAVLAEELIKHPDQFFAPTTFVATQPKVDQIFVSHAAADRLLAEFLRDEVSKRRPGSNIFLASRPGHIRTGHEWWRTIQLQLRTADAYIILLTPISVGRAWIPFETGAAWMTGRLLLTVSAGGLDKGSIGNPLGFFQVNSLEDRDEAEAFLTDIGAAADNLETFCGQIRALTAAAVEEAQRDEGWAGVSIGTRYFAWDGPRLHDLKDWPPVPTPAGLIEAIREAGLTPSYGVPEKLNHHLAKGRLQVFESDKRSYRRPVLGGGAGLDQILLVRDGPDT